MTSSAGSREQSANWNLPNAITVVRILMAPLVFWLLLADAGADGPMRWWAAVIFIVAAASAALETSFQRIVAEASGEATE